LSFGFGFGRGFDPVYQGVSSSMKGYLQEVVRRGEMELLVKSED
jgi:hypothetical protein